jgi:endoglucanase
MVTKIGGVDPKTLLASEVIIHGVKDVPGVIGAKPPHLLDPKEREISMKLSDMYIDCAMSKEEVSKYVSIGDSITMKPFSADLLGNFFSSKALDNRVSFVSMLIALDELQNIAHDADIYFVATVQEEVHLTGGIISSFNISPDLAIVVDVCHADIAEAEKELTQKIEGGPSISLGPTYSKKFTEKLIDLASDENIPYQTIIEASGRGTEAYATQVSGCGIPSLLISIPLKYMHTPVEMVSENDIKAVGRLIASFISKLSDNDLRQEEPAWMSKF